VQSVGLHSKQFAPKVVRQDVHTVAMTKMNINSSLR